MRKNKLLAILIIFLFPPSVFSQLKIRGKIIDAGNKPVEFAEVLLLKKDSIALKSELSDEKGNFLIEEKKGNYLLKIRQMGKILYHQTIELDHDTDIGIIKVENVQMLQEVIIEGKKSLISRNGDKIILNIKGNGFLKGKSTLDILKYAPYVKVDNNSGNIYVKNNSALILINGKSSNMPISDLNNYLGSLSNKELESIEIITNPSAKYNAEGNGIINIITKTPDKYGINGNLNSGLTVSKFISSNSSIQLDSKLNDKFSIITFFAYKAAKNAREEERIEKLKSPFIEYNYMKRDTGKNLYYYTSASLLYDINKKNQLGAGFSFSKLNNENKLNNNLSIISNDNSKSLGLYSNKMDDKYYNLNLNYNLKIDSVGQNLSGILDFYNSDYKTRDLYKNLFFDMNENLTNSNKRRSFTPTLNKIFSAQLDYQKAFKKNQIEAGFKYALVNNSNTTVFENELGGIFVPDNSLTNKYNYREQILAAYMSYSIDSLFQKNISLKTGLRAEYTNGNGQIPVQNYTLRKEYIDFFPSLFLTRHLKNNNSINFSYSRRINRPDYNSFNPTIFYLTDFTSQVGSPDLNPSYTHAFELGYSSSEWNILLYYDAEKGESREILKRLDQNMLQYQWRNIDCSNEFGISFSANKKIVKWLDILVNASWYRKKYKSNFDDADNINVTKGTAQGKISSLFKLPFNYSSEISFEYNGPETYGQYQSGKNYAFYFNLTKKINDKLSFYLKVTDPFDNLRYSFINTQNEIQTFQYKNNYSRSMAFSLIYNFGFGNKTKPIKINNSNEEEKDRAN